MLYLVFFFFNDTATTEIYTLSLHDALPIYSSITTILSPFNSRVPTNGLSFHAQLCSSNSLRTAGSSSSNRASTRSEEHTSELQSRQYLVCRLLLEKNNHSVPHAS